MVGVLKIFDDIQLYENVYEALTVHGAYIPSLGNFIDYILLKG